MAPRALRSRLERTSWPEANHGAVNRTGGVSFPSRRQAALFDDCAPLVAPRAGRRSGALSLARAAAPHVRQHDALAQRSPALRAAARRLALGLSSAPGLCAVDATTFRNPGAT